MKVRIDRNSRTSIISDIEFLRATIADLRERHSIGKSDHAIEMLMDWKRELIDEEIKCIDGFPAINALDEGGEWELPLPPIMDTSTGKKIDLLDPKPDDFTIEDIAFGLCSESRYAGHLNGWFYSVADHSVRVAEATSPMYAVAALLHDASEAYLKDLPKPLKQLLPNYHSIELRFMRAIAEKFGFQWPMPNEVKQVDRAVFKTEWVYFREVPNGHKYLFTGQDNCGCPADKNVRPEMFIAAFMECQKRQHKALENNSRSSFKALTHEN